MAIFRPTKTNVCELNFDDKYTYTLPIHEETINNISSIATKQLEMLKQLDTTDKNSIDTAYNSALDAIDDILGEGASDEIMSLFENAGILEVAGVINFIATEYANEYKKALEKYKANGTIPDVKRGRR